MPVKIAFIDFWQGFDASCNFITQSLDRVGVRYEIVNPQDADYMFCSCMGRTHNRYRHPVKIFYSGENLSPDFNLYDYCITSDDLSFGDRHLRLPYWWVAMGDEKRRAVPRDAEKRKFCNFVYTNSFAADPMRERLFQGLSSYKRVDSGGRHLNNIGGPVADKREFIAGYKFTIACENSRKPGYATEKVIEPLLMRTLPIYWGDPDLLKDFNPDALITGSSVDEIVRQVQRLDNDDEAYISKLDAPMFRPGRDVLGEYRDGLDKFIGSIFAQTPAQAHRRVEYGKSYQAGMTEHMLDSMDRNALLKCLTRLLNRKYHTSRLRP